MAASPENLCCFKTAFLLFSLVLVYTWMGYPLLLYIYGLLFRRRRVSDEAFRPAVTLIIPAHNEEACIERKIVNSLELDYPAEKMEILLCSDASTDATAAIGGRFAPRVRVLDYRERAGKMGTVNKAVREAKGDIIILTDSNAMFAGYTVKEMVKHFADPRVGVVCGAKIIRNLGMENSTGMGESGYWKYESFIKYGETLSGSCAGADGSVYAVRRSLYPFPPDDRVIMDDFAVSLLVVKKGFECIYEPQARAFEESGSGMRQEFRRKGRIFAGALSFLMMRPGAIFSSVFIKLLSHKILRWFTFLFQIGLLVSTLPLAHLNLFRPLLGLQVLFYACSLAGLALNHYGVRIPAFHIPYYFNMTTFAQAYGFWYYFRHGRRPAWEKLR